MYNKKEAFTIVELVVVITIWAILSAIAFVVYTDYTKGSRDSVRKADFDMLEKSLEMYFTDNGHYPSPEDKVAIKYNGEELWNQWILWDSIRSQLKDFPYTPIDTLTESFYSYSITNDKKEYEIATIFESPESQIISSIFPQTYAFTKKKARTYVVWNYNGILISTQIGDIDYLLVTPSIITNDISENDFTTIINQNKLAYKWFWNLPASYIDTDFDIAGWDEKWLVNTGASLVVFSGSLRDITREKEIDDARIALIEALQLSYQNTIPEITDESIQNLVNLNTAVVDEKLICNVRKIINNIFKVHLSLDQM